MAFVRRILRRGCAAGREVRISAATSLRAGLLAALAIGFAFQVAKPTSAETVGQADSSAQSRQEALNTLPLDQLTPAAQQKLWPVVSGASIYRRLPAEVVTCDRDMYLTLIRNPEIIVGIWHLMDVTELDMKRTAPFTFDCDDKAGTTSQVELSYGTPNMHIYYAETLYEGSRFARPVNGRVVLFLRSEYFNDEQGRPQVKSGMDAFIRIDHITAKLVARTMSPLIVRTADHNFVESFRFVGRVHESAEENSPGMRELATRLVGVNAQTQQTFADVATLVGQRAEARTQLPVAHSPSTFPASENSSPARQENVFGQRDQWESANSLPPRAINLRR